MGRLSTSTEIVQANCETTCTAGRGLWTTWTKNAMTLALQKDVRVQHKQIKNSMKNTWIIICITWPLALMGRPRKFSGRIAKPRTRPSVDCGLPELPGMPCSPGLMKAYLRFGWGEPCVVGAPWTAIDRWRGSQYRRTRVHSIPRRSRSEAVTIIAQNLALAIFTFMVDNTFWFAMSPWYRRNLSFFFMNDKNMYNKDIFWCSAGDATTANECAVSRAHAPTANRHRHHTVSRAYTAMRQLEGVYLSRWPLRLRRAVHT